MMYLLFNTKVSNGLIIIERLGETNQYSIHDENVMTIVQSIMLETTCKTHAKQ